MDIPHASQYRNKNQNRTQHRRSNQRSHTNNTNYRGNKNTESNFWPILLAVGVGALVVTYIMAPVLTVMGILVTGYLLLKD